MSSPVPCPLSPVPCPLPGVPTCYQRVTIRVTIRSIGFRPEFDVLPRVTIIFEKKYKILYFFSKMMVTRGNTSNSGLKPIDLMVTRMVTRW